jgi:hypothetical protein
VALLKGEAWRRVLRFLVPFDYERGFIVDAILFADLPQDRLFSPRNPGMRCRFPFPAGPPRRLDPNA